MQYKQVVTFLVLALLTAAAPAPDAVAEARKHFEAGRALYAVGRFQDAAAEFEAGFVLAPRPLFVFNAAQALRRLAEVSGDRGTMERAKERYLDYLRLAPPRDPEREQSQVKLAGIEQWLKENPAPLDTPTREPTEKLVPTPSVEVAPAPEAPPTTVVVERKGFLLEHPWLFAVIGGVAVGAAVGTYFGVRQAQGGCPLATLGCLDAR